MPNTLQPLPEPDYFRITGAPTQSTAGNSFSITVTEFDYATGRIAHDNGTAILTRSIGGKMASASLGNLSVGSSTQTSERGA